MEYSPAVVRHFDAPKRAGELPPGTPGLVSGEAEDRTLHVWVRFELELGEGIVRAAAFQAYGCPHTVAAASIVADWLEGRPVDAARSLDVRALCADLEVPVEKLGKLLRIEDAVADCWRAAP
ncbi:MAG TPA: iron-sulfur cluster assembly scaffold protein [Gammaproteobacteria bacterium]